MFRLVTPGVLPSRFLYLKDDVPLCESLIFVTERISKWITKGKKLGYIRKETGNNPLSEVSVDQPQPTQK